MELEDIPPGWHIQYNPKPIPDFSYDWDYWHDNCDIDNPLCGTASSREKALEGIAEMMEELGDE